MHRSSQRAASAIAARCVGHRTVLHFARVPHAIFSLYASSGKSNPPASPRLHASSIVSFLSFYQIDITHTAGHFAWNKSARQLIGPQESVQKDYAPYCFPTVNTITWHIRTGVRYRQVCNIDANKMYYNV